MRILFAIAHVFNPQGSGAMPSVRKDPAPRINGLRACIEGIYHTFGPRHHKLDITVKRTFPSNLGESHDLDIVVCTTRGLHVLDQLGLPQGLYREAAGDVEPMMVGFECQAVLREHLGKFDYYCFMEDDLVLHDPWFFHKLAWFNKQAGDDSLLQPNRYEASVSHTVQKLYMDGEITPAATSRYQNIQDRPEMRGSVMGVPVLLRRTTNPHSGCYFLSARQMEHWASRPHFLDRDCSFVTPLESAATLGVMKTFRIYKPVRENANFLEILHCGHEFLNNQRVGNKSGIRPVIG